MFLVLLLISLLFITSLVVKHLINRPLCSLCISIALTWIALLVLYKIDRFHDQVLLGLLMGQSVTGVFYLAYRRLPKALRIFSLPFFLSLTLISYILITDKIVLPAFFLLAVLWIGAWIIFSYRDDPGKKTLAKIATECCEDV